MSNELKGTVKFIGQVETGTSKTNKEWSKRLFVITTEGQYPKDVAFTLMGDKTAYIDKYPVGASVNVKFDLDSREFNGKWFTNANAYSVFGDSASQPTSGLTTASGTMPNQQTPLDQPEGNDLPF